MSSTSTNDDRKYCGARTPVLASEHRTCGDNRRALELGVLGVDSLGVRRSNTTFGDDGLGYRKREETWRYSRLRC